MPIKFFREDKDLGPTGPTGPTGVGGAAGTAGPTGPTGPSGGPIGPTGPGGANGVTGPTGPAGADGSDGAAGAAGVTGPTGPTGAAGADGSDGSDGAAGAAGAAGATGTSAGQLLNWNTATADSDQDAGDIWSNNSTVSSITILYIDDANANGANIEEWIKMFDDSTTTALRGTITINELGDASQTAIFNVTGALTDGTGYWKIPVSHVASNVGSLADGDTVGVAFSRTGNVGVTGPTGPGGGATGPTGPAGADGSDGSDGSQGAKGDTGNTGSQGTAGSNGSNGSDGAKGDKGDTGNTGSQGTAGSQGAKGDKGDTGTQGTVGTHAGLLYTFSTGTFNNLTSGLFKVNNNSQQKNSTEVHISYVMLGSVNVGSFINSWGTFGSSKKGHLHIKNDSGSFLTYEVTNVVSNGVSQFGWK